MKKLDNRGSVGIATAIMAPAMLLFLAVITDTGVWIMSQTRLQMAADAAAMGAALAVKSNSSASNAALASVAAEQAAAAAPKVSGINVASATFDGVDTVRVTITAVAPLYFAGLTNVIKVNNSFLAATPAPTVTATATAKVPASVSYPCIMTLAPTGTGIQVDNSGVINAQSCPLFSKAKDSNTTIASIYLNSGSITATTIGSLGIYAQSNSGSNVVSGTIQQNQATAPAAPYAGQATPAGNACGSTTTYNFTAYQATPYSFTPTTWCGSVTIGGNSTTQTFAPGVYYIVNGNLTFNNANITSASGVSFVLTGSNPGNFSYTNYSNTNTNITAPSSGPTAGVVVWQGCNATPGSQTTSFQGGSTLTLTGAIYAPCSRVDLGNNAKLTGPSGTGLSLTSYSLYVHGSAQLITSTVTGGGSGNIKPPMLAF